LAADGDALLDADELPDELVEEATEMLSRETRPLTSNSSVTWSWLDQYVVSATVGGRKEGSGAVTVLQAGQDCGLTWIVEDVVSSSTQMVSHPRWRAMTLRGLVG
jgi:hypothetical protein